ncbi:MAG: hypothetical protein GX270_13880 [Clostridiaceae bacterium]|jgi:uncharacterized membrane protein|nr:hypothetical protein [Clostridiaceae bacterium]
MFDFYDYYKKISGLYNLLFRYIPIRFFGIIIFNILTGLISIFVVIKLFIGNSLAHFLIIITFVGLFFTSLWFLAHFSKSVAKDRYKADIKGIRVGMGVYDIIQAKIVDKLIELNWYTPSKVEKLITRYEKHAESLKFKIPVIPSVFVVLFIPLWSQFIAWVFKYVSTFEQGIKAFGTFTVAIITVAIVLCMIKLYFENTFLEFINRDYYRMKNLARRLEDILLGMDENPRLDAVAD